MPYSFARALITKYHRLGGLNNSSGGCKFKIKMLAGLVSCEVSLPDHCLLAPSSHDHFSVLTHPSGLLCVYKYPLPLRTLVRLD